MKPAGNQSILRVAINAQLLTALGVGGTESHLAGLISALGSLEGPAEEYVVISHPEEPEWPEKFTGANQSVIAGPKPLAPDGRYQALRKVVRPLKKHLSQQKVDGRSNSEIQWPQIPVSNGFYERLQVSVIHFPFQEFVLCSIPSIYTPHDLQHRHFPQFFSVQELVWREKIYRAGCHLSHCVAAGSQWIKEDVMREFGVPDEKIQVIPWAPPTLVYSAPTPEMLSKVTAKHALKTPFAFYPAATWEHKNHLRLLEALALLRDRDGLTVSLLCTGNQFKPFWPQIEQAMTSLRLENQVRFLGMVPPDELRSLYRLAQFVIVPTLFEATSGPVFEAWQDSVPVACSNVTSLPDQVRDAALLFDPYSVEQIANAVARLAADSVLRDSLVRKGKNRLKDFSWERTAKAYRALYRRLARRPMTEEDRHLLNWNWMRNPPGEASEIQTST